MATPEIYLCPIEELGFAEYHGRRNFDGYGDDAFRLSATMTPEIPGKATADA